MNKQQQIEEMVKDFTKLGITTRQGTGVFAEMLYNAGYRKVPYGAVDEITRHNSVEAELQELNIKYYNEAKDLRRELAKAEAENERLTEKLKQVLLSIDTVKEMNAISRCTIDEHRKQAVKDFSEKLKAKCNDNGYWDGDNDDINNEFFVSGKIDIDEIEELLKEYESGND